MTAVCYYFIGGFEHMLYTYVAISIGCIVSNSCRTIIIFEGTGPVRYGTVRYGVLFSHNIKEIHDVTNSPKISGL